MLNYIWSFLMILGLLVAGLVGRLSGEHNVMSEAFDATKTAVMTIALPLAGMMMFWMGTLRLLEKAGVLEFVVKLLSPLLRRLFPDVPRDHPALGAMMMNWCANMLGLGNAATPLGLKAMSHLNELNPNKQSASNAMVTFLALNTGAFTLIPMGAIIYLNTAGLPNAQRVIVPTILASACATVAAIFAAKMFQRLPMFATEPDVEITDAAVEAKPASTQISALGKALLVMLSLTFIAIAALELGPVEWREGINRVTGIGTIITDADVRAGKAKADYARLKESVQPTPTNASLQTWRRAMDGASGLAIPAILLTAIGLSLARGVKVYEEFVEGAKEGFGVATRIMPFLVAMLSMLAVLRASGVFALLERLLAPLLNAIGFPVELLTLALMRPLSGSGASGILTEILTRHDFSEQVKFTGAVMYGSTETTFYVLALYFGSVGIKKIRHGLVAGLTADLVGMIAAVVFGRLVFSLI
jgi:spore maturation protein SpmA